MKKKIYIKVANVEAIADAVKKPLFFTADYIEFDDQDISEEDLRAIAEQHEDKEAFNAYKEVKDLKKELKDKGFIE